MKFVLTNLLPILFMSGCTVGMSAPIVTPILIIWLIYIIYKTGSVPRSAKIGAIAIGLIIVLQFINPIDLEFTEDTHFWNVGITAVFISFLTVFFPQSSNQETVQASLSRFVLRCVGQSLLITYVVGGLASFIIGISQGDAFVDMIGGSGAFGGLGLPVAGIKSAVIGLGIVLWKKHKTPPVLTVDNGH